MIGAKLKLKNSLGFTLVEMMMAISIFALASVAAVTIFVQTNSTQKRTMTTERATQESKYLSEYFVSNLKRGELNYEINGVYSPGQISNISDVVNFKFRTQDGLYSSWRLMPVGSRKVWQQCQATSTYCNSAGVWQDLHSPLLSVESLTFYVMPTVSPWQADPQSGFLNNQQPLVMMSAKIKYLDANNPNPRTVLWQTMTASRIYRR